MAGIYLATSLVSAQVLIQPVVVDFAPKQKTMAVSVTLSEQAKAPVRLQAELLKWQQDLGGQSLTEPSEDLLISPPIAELQPGQRQVFRIALRGTRPSPNELAYRLILEDIAEPQTDEAKDAGMAITFRMRYDLPVLIAPAGKVANLLRWKPCSSIGNPSAEACIRVLNAGNRRVKVQTITLDGSGWQQSLSLKGGETVLAGTEREWRLPLPPGQSGAPTAVTVETARGETLQAGAGGF